MKITRVDVIKVDTGISKSIGCRVYTDTGIYGDGECSLAVGAGAEAAAAMIARLAKFIIGKNPLHTEAIWDSLLRLQSVFWGQNGGPIVYGGMSALDIALWDIKGKAYGAPVYELLGGKHRDSLRAYASRCKMAGQVTAIRPGNLMIMPKRQKLLLIKDLMRLK